ncbi:hypothetical protein FOL47_000203 [Perkinsus chesapeaki]|uniref:Uncharacterized protein n=1 Tax=Perkinsus chesapeaki TaxID=330153 RepID=A0A7J6MMI8_PERCH|nr:hypothetical protein FOL47_000203 [Perkinsus chesapeaki]
MALLIVAQDTAHSTAYIDDVFSELAGHMDLDGLKYLVWEFVGLRKPCGLKVAGREPSGIYSIVGSCGDDIIGLRQCRTSGKSQIVALREGDLAGAGKLILESESWLTDAWQSSLCTDGDEKIYHVDNTDKVYEINNTDVSGEMRVLKTDVPESALLYRTRLIDSTLYVGCAGASRISRVLCTVDLASGKFDTVKCNGEDVEFLYAFDVQKTATEGMTRIAYLRPTRGRPRLELVIVTVDKDGMAKSTLTLPSSGGMHFRFLAASDGILCMAEGSELRLIDTESTEVLCKCDIGLSWGSSIESMSMDSIRLIALNSHRGLEIINVYVQYRYTAEDSCTNEPDCQ